MVYDALDDSNKIREADIHDGYNGRMAHVSYHVVNGVEWVKANCGCFRSGREIKE